MATIATFKQECPTCGAMVRVKDDQIGKKIECTECKDKFVAERPDEDDTPRGKSKAGSNGRKSTDTADEEDEDEVQVKSKNGKHESNGKAKHVDDDDDVQDDDEPRGKSKKESNSNSTKLTITLGLAVVGVLLLGVVAFVLFKGRGQSGTPTGGTGTASTKKDDAKSDATSDIKITDAPKVSAVAVALDNAEIGRLTNFLPNDTEYVLHLFLKDIFGASSFAYEAAFQSPGSLDAANLSRRLGFPVTEVDDLIRAERYSSPSWKYTIIHFRSPVREGDLKVALNLKLAGAPIEGQTYYKLTDPHPVLDTLAGFSLGVPSYLYSFTTPRPDPVTYVRLHDPQTLIIGDEAPVTAFLKEKGSFKQLSARTTPPPTAAAPETPPETKKQEEKKPPERPKSKLQPKGAPKKGMSKPGGGASLEQVVPGRTDLQYANESIGPGTFDHRLAGFPAEPPQDSAQWIKGLPGKTYAGPENDNSSLQMMVNFSDSNCIISSGLLKVNQVAGVWKANGNIIEITTDKIPGTIYKLELKSADTMVGTGQDSARTWTVSLKLQGGPSGAATDPNAAPGAPDPGKLPSDPNRIANDDRYLTIPPALKSALDRVEARGKDGQDRVLISSAVNMDANRVDTSLPEYRDRVIHRPRHFWDVSVMLREPTPRIRMLGTSVMQWEESSRYRVRNELSCTQDSDAAEIKKEIVTTTSFTIAQFFRRLFNHEVRLPLPPQAPVVKKNVKTAAPSATASQARKATTVNFSRMKVEQQGNMVEFELDLILDNSTLNQLQGIAALAAGTIRAEIEAAASRSVRHMLAKAGRTMAEKGMSDRGVSPGTFPPGAFPRGKTPFHIDQEPRNRISWMAGLLPYMGQQHLYNRLQFDQSWREPGNWMAGNAIVPQFLAPNYPEYTRRVVVGELPLEFGATHVVGMSGVGLDAASYRRSDPATAHKRGIFSNDGSASIEEIQKGRGLANTIAMIQIPHDGTTGVSPWIAGGGATQRGVPEKNSIGPFVLSKDKYGKPIEYKSKRGAQVMMADGSVRFVEQSVSDDVFKAMSTIQGPAPADFNPNANPLTPLIPPPEGRDDDLPPEIKLPAQPTKPSDKSPKSSGPTFFVDGYFSIGTPPGFRWTFPQDIKIGFDSATVYTCTSEGSKSTIVLAMEPKRYDTDEKKRNSTEKALNEAEAILKKQGLNVVVDIKPKLDSPIPNRIEFRVKYGTKDGQGVSHSVVIFGRNTYSITAVAASENEAKDLLRVADSFKELAPDAAQLARDSAGAPARHKGDGRIFDGDHGFSIVPPKGWQMGALPPAQGPLQPMFLLTGPAAADLTVATLLIGAIPNDGTPIESIAPQIKKGIDGKGQTIVEDGFVTLDGKKAYRISLKGPAEVNGKNVQSGRLVYLMLGADNRAILMSFSCSVSAFDGLRKMMEEAAQSARLD